MPGSGPADNEQVLGEFVLPQTKRTCCPSRVDDVAKSVDTVGNVGGWRFQKDVLLLVALAKELAPWLAPRLDVVAALRIKKSTQPEGVRRFTYHRGEALRAGSPGLLSAWRSVPTLPLFSFPAICE